ncbi:hypothetical protein DF051_39250 [Burkholderia contaminans]|uniref:Uncharacterized protein n=1 Tax=Burkholderia contaminans TaxID=488447 RepID=A0A3N8NSP5_9BURK|nr:hypothetical protein DF051_39250 [Burkholderia contaminans]
MTIEWGVPRTRASDDRCSRCFTRDEGRPFGVGLQGQAPNHHELRGSRVRVVSVDGKGRVRLCQVRIEETNASEPLKTCRNCPRRCRNRRAHLLRDKIGRCLLTARSASGT